MKTPSSKSPTKSTPPGRVAETNKDMATETGAAFARHSRAEIPARRIVFLCLLLCLALTVGERPLRAFDRRWMDYGEGPLLATVTRMLQERPSRAWLDQPPLTLSCYGPAYFWTAMAATKALGRMPGVLPGRLVSVAACLGIAALIAAVVWGGTASGTAAVLIGLMFLATPLVMHWSAAYRVDMLAAFFVVLAYGLALRPRGALASALSIVFASLVKQTAVLYGIPIVLFYWMNGRKRDAGIWAATLTAAAVPLWTAVFLSAGGYFRAAFFLANARGWEFLGAPGKLHVFAVSPCGILPLLLIAYWFVTRDSRLRSSLVCTGFLGSLVIASLLVCVEGSGDYYFIEASALGAMVIGTYGLPLILQANPVRGHWVLLAVGLLVTWPSVESLTDGIGRRFELPADYPAIIHVVQSAPDRDILADGGWIEAVMLGGRLPLVNDSYLLRMMRDHGKTDARTVASILATKPAVLVLAASIEAHRARRGVLRAWPPEVLEAMARQYELKYSSDGLFIYMNGKNP
ncbi:MAG: hypothetical protein N3D11_04765 [Candidatus Sumerlaeia bacterium]|nr:hypothetical protein [Candidatus Sumerlaeia bacterium]